MFSLSPHSCSLCIYMEKCTNEQGKVGALRSELWGVLTILLKCLHFISRRGSLPLGRPFCGAFENASAASYQKVLPGISIVIFFRACLQWSSLIRSPFALQQRWLNSSKNEYVSVIAETVD